MCVISSVSAFNPDFGWGPSAAAGSVQCGRGGTGKRRCSFIVTHMRKTQGVGVEKSETGDSVQIHEVQHGRGCNSV